MSALGVKDKPLLHKVKVKGYSIWRNTLCPYCKSWRSRLNNATSECTISFTSIGKSYLGVQPNFVFALVASPINKSTSVGLKYSLSIATNTSPDLGMFSLDGALFLSIET